MLVYTLRQNDRILVIGDGQILESGNHQSLMRERGRYYEMVMSQLGKGLQKEIIRQDRHGVTLYAHSPSHHIKIKH